MFVVAGLGNPGNKYQLTRHNIGFIAVDFLAQQLGLTYLEKNKFKIHIAQGAFAGSKVLLCKPDDFMNLSGPPIANIMNFYKVPIRNLIVIHDDLDLPFGKIKHKLGGGSGGHNGLKSLDQALGSNLYQRLRIGIDRPENKDFDISRYVLSNLESDEQEILSKKIADLFRNIEHIFSGNIEKFYFNLLPNKSKIKV